LTRSTRTLLVLSVLGVGGVVALDLMARRYADLLDRAPGDGASAGAIGAAPAPGGGSRAAGEAERLVEAYVRVREDLASNGVEPGGAEAALARALAAHDLGPTAWARLRTLHRDWAAGEPVAPAFAASFEARRDRLGAP